MVEDGVVTLDEFYRHFLLKGLIVFFILFLPFCIYANYLDRDVDNLFIIILFSCMISLAFAFIGDMVLFIISFLFTKSVSVITNEICLYEIVKLDTNSSPEVNHLIYRESKDSVQKEVFVHKINIYNENQYKLVYNIVEKQIFGKRVKILKCELLIPGKLRCE